MKLVRKYQVDYLTNFLYLVGFNTCKKFLIWILFFGAAIWANRETARRAHGLPVEGPSAALGRRVLGGFGQVFWFLRVFRLFLRVYRLFLGRFLRVHRLFLGMFLRVYRLFLGRFLRVYRLFLRAYRLFLGRFLRVYRLFLRVFDCFWDIWGCFWEF